MTRYILSRFAQALLVIWAAYTVAFFLLYALPSDPISLLLGTDSVEVSESERVALAAEYGFDKPLIVQYALALFDLLRGDLGFSFQMGRGVSSILVNALGSTIQLALLGLIFAVVGGVGTALLATYSRNNWLRQILLSLPSLAVSIPAFWFGLLLIQVFSFQLQWLPAFSAEGFTSMILPALTLALPTSAMIAQVFAWSLEDNMREAYSETAFAKGAPRFVVISRHAARNALLPVLTITGLVIGQLLSGTVVTETIFSRPGLGRVIAASVANQDIPVVLGAVLICAVLYSATNLIVDLLYPVVDPRQRQRFGHSKKDTENTTTNAPASPSSRKESSHDTLNTRVG